MTNKRQLLINRQIGWMDNNNFLPLYTITKFSTDGKKYYRTYDDNTGEWMRTDILLKNLDIRKLFCPSLSNELLQCLLKGRSKTANEKAFDKQLSYYENYGTIRQGK